MNTRPAVDGEPQTVRGNALIGQLAVHERNAIHRTAEMVSFAAGEPLLRAHATTDVVLFPIDCVASIIRMLSDGTSLELALIGNEGVVGMDVFFDVHVRRDDAIVRSPGWAYRIGATDLQNALRRGEGLQRQLLRFAGELSAQIAQTAVCTKFHQPEERLARWLLMIHERTSTRSIPAATAAIRSALGVDGSRVTTAVKRLSAAGCIRATEDSVAIVDVDALEASACECYEPLAKSEA